MKKSIDYLNIITFDPLIKGEFKFQNRIIVKILYYSLKELINSFIIFRILNSNYKKLNL